MWIFSIINYYNEEKRLKKNNIFCLEKMALIFKCTYHLASFLIIELETVRCKIFCSVIKPTC